MSTTTVVMSSTCISMSDEIMDESEALASDFIVHGAIQSHLVGSCNPIKGNISEYSELFTNGYETYL